MKIASKGLWTGSLFCVERDYLYVLVPTLKKSKNSQVPHLFALRKYYKSPCKCILSFCYLDNTIHTSVTTHLEANLTNHLLMKLI